MNAYTLHRYFRNRPAGTCLSRERLILGLRNVAWRMGLEEDSETLRGWLRAFGEEFDLAEEEIHFLQLPNMPSSDGTRRLEPSFPLQSSPLKE